MCYLRLLTLIALMAINVIPSTSMDSEVREYDPKVAKKPWQDYPCLDPQPRAYILPDLMKSGYLKAEESVNMPFYIVLKRCDVHAGCCATSIKTCAPIRSEIYYEKVEIEIESLLTNSTRKEWIQVEQHGKCACMNTSTQQWQRLERQHPKIKKFSPTRESSNS